MARPLIPFEDYCRISRVIAAVLDAVDANTPRACLFFAIAGAHILRSVYRINAVPMAGAAFYRVDEATGFTIAFGELDGGAAASHDHAFHCWLIADGFVIDFMAPIFQSSAKAGGRTEKVPPRMLQKSLANMAASPYELAAEGDFYLAPNLDLGMRLIEGWMRKPGNDDLVKICQYWYTKPPRPISPTLEIGSNDGLQIKASLRPLILEGAW